MTARQLTLGFEHRPSLSGDDFLVAPENADAVAWLDRCPDWPGPALVIYGPAGSGKSHLAQVFLEKFGGAVITACKLALMTPEQALASNAALVLENADRFLDPELEETLFHLYNLARETGVFLLLTSREAPSRWQIGLPDLASRLKAAPAVAIHAPSDALLAAVLVKQFSDRQLKVDQDLIAYIGARVERSFAAAGRLVAALDALSLAEKKNITKDLVRRVLAQMELSPPEQETPPSCE